MVYLVHPLSNSRRQSKHGIGGPPNFVGKQTRDLRGRKQPRHRLSGFLTSRLCSWQGFSPGVARRLLGALRVARHRNTVRPRQRSGSHTVHEPGRQPGGLETHQPRERLLDLQMDPSAVIRLTTMDHAGPQRLGRPRVLFRASGGVARDSFHLKKVFKVESTTVPKHQQYACSTVNASGVSSGRLDWPAFG